MASVVTFPSPLPAEEIQLYMNILDCVLLLSLYLHGFSSSWYPLIKGKSAAQTFFCSLTSLVSPAITSTLKFFFPAFLSLVCEAGFVQKITPCYSNSQQWCSCPSAKLIMQAVLKHFYFCALNSFSELVS